MVVKQSATGEGFGIFAARVFDVPEANNAELTHEWEIVEGVGGKMQKRVFPPYNGQMLTHSLFMAMHLMHDYNSLVKANEKACYADVYLDQKVNVQMLSNGMFVEKRNINCDK